MNLDQTLFEKFRQLPTQLAAAGFSRFELRRFNSIVNALEIQVEEGFAGGDAAGHLISALYAVANTYEKKKADTLIAAIKTIESAAAKP